MRPQSWSGSQQESELDSPFHSGLLLSSEEQTCDEPPSEASSLRQGISATMDRSNALDTPVGTDVPDNEKAIIVPALGPVEEFGDFKGPPRQNEARKFPRCHGTCCSLESFSMSSVATARRRKDREPAGRNDDQIGSKSKWRNEILQDFSCMGLGCIHVPRAPQAKLVHAQGGEDHDSCQSCSFADLLSGGGHEPDPEAEPTGTRMFRRSWMEAGVIHEHSDFNSDMSKVSSKRHWSL